MLMQNEYMPDEISPPGESLADVLEERGMTQAALARRLGMAEKTISGIINGKAPITPETALKLEMILSIPARFWNARQSQYDEFLAHRKYTSQLESHIHWLDRFPYQEMVQYGWLRDHETPLEKLRELLQFFGFSHPEDWEPFWEDFMQKAGVALRTSPAYANEHESLAAWLRQGERQALAVECAPYDAQRFTQALRQIRSLTVQSPAVYQTEAQRLCAEAGVALVFVPELSGMRASGATRWQKPEQALIQLSLRYKRDDHLWFSFFHEAGHILNDGKREIFVELDDPREEDADRFAGDFLIPPEQYRLFLAQVRRHISQTQVVDFAKSLGISPGIVVGRLQHDGHLPHSHLNGLKQSLVWRQLDQL